MDKNIKGGPKSKGIAETKSGKYIKYNSSNCTKTITNLKTDKSTTVKMGRAECASKGGSEKPITRSPKQQTQFNKYTARAQRAKNTNMSNK